MTNARGLLWRPSPSRFGGRLAHSARGRSGDRRRGSLAPTSSGGLGRNAYDRCSLRPGSAFAPAAHCCFTSPRYVGTCDVAPSVRRDVRSILAYLNNPQSQGKAYCGSTSLRGDWKSAACEPKTTGD